jgi:acetyltransferase-like isoleucine patch superfamily enzyme
MKCRKKRPQTYSGIQRRVSELHKRRVGFEIGSHVWIGEEVMILSLAKVRIGSDVCTSQRAFLCTGSHAFQQEDFALITRPIDVNSSSWIAAQAFIGPGVEIGSGAVASAGAVVLDNLLPQTLVQGNPARCIKQISRDLGTKPSEPLSHPQTKTAIRR